MLRRPLASGASWAGGTRRAVPSPTAAGPAKPGRAEPDLPRLRAFRIVDGVIAEHDLLISEQ